LLSEVERDAFAQLAVFEGGFAIEAAEEVIDLSHHADSPFVLDVVQTLKDKSLLRTETNSAHEMRLTMLRSIHDYAREKLTESSGTESSVFRRHATYFLQEGKRQAKATTTDRRTESLAWLASNRQNLLAITRRFAATSPLQAVGAVLALHPLLAEREAAQVHRSILSSAADWARESDDATALCEVLLAHSDLELERGDAERSLALVEEAQTLLNESAPLLRATMLVLHGRVLYRLGRFEEGAAAFDTAEPLAKAQGAHSIVARILMQRGMLALSTLDVPQTFLQDALRLTRKCANRDLEARVLGNIGVDHMVRGRIFEAKDSMLQALALHKDHKAKGLEGLVMGNLGSVCMTLGDAQESRAWLLDAITIHRELGNRLLEGADLNNLAATLLDLSRPNEAIENAECALQFIEQTNGARERLLCLCYLSIANACLDKVDRAETLFKRAQDQPSWFSQSHIDLFKLVQAHIDLAVARVSKAGIEDPRVQAVAEALRALEAQKNRIFLPLVSLRNCVDHYPKRPPPIEFLATPSDTAGD